MARADKYIRFRIPERERDFLKERAKYHRHTMSAEIVALIRKKMKASESEIRPSLSDAPTPKDKES